MQRSEGDSKRCQGKLLGLAACELLPQIQKHAMCIALFVLEPATRRPGRSCRPSSIRFQKSIAYIPSERSKMQMSPFAFSRKLEVPWMHPE